MLEEYIRHVPAQVYWLLFFFSSLIENLFPPFPGDTITVFGGALASGAALSLTSLGSSIFAGSVFGAVIMYYLGERIVGILTKHVRLKPIQRLSEPERMQRAHDWLERNGALAIILSRFSAALRYFVAIIAGSLRMHIGKFILFFSIATVLWNTVLVAAGYLIGDNWQQITQFVRYYSWIAVAVLATTALSLFIYSRRRSLW